MDIKGWFPLGLTGSISLQSNELSRVFSRPTVWKHWFFGTQPPSWSKWWSSAIPPLVSSLPRHWWLCFKNTSKGSWEGFFVPLGSKAHLMEEALVTSRLSVFHWNQLIFQHQLSWLFATQWPPQLWFQIVKKEKKRKEKDSVTAFNHEALWQKSDFSPGHAGVWKEGGLSITLS